MLIDIVLVELLRGSEFYVATSAKKVQFLQVVIKIIVFCKIWRWSAQMANVMALRVVKMLLLGRV